MPRVTHRQHRRSPAALSALHIPQISIFAVAGDVGWREVASGTIGIFFMALPLAALVERFRTVWPAVVAHTVPFTAATLLTPSGAVGCWAVLALTGVASLFAAVLLRPRSEVTSG